MPRAAGGRSRHVAGAEDDVALGRRSRGRRSCAASRSCRSRTGRAGSNRSGRHLQVDRVDRDRRAVALGERREFEARSVHVPGPSFSRGSKRYASPQRSFRRFHRHGTRFQARKRASRRARRVCLDGPACFIGIRCAFRRARNHFGGPRVWLRARGEPSVTFPQIFSFAIIAAMMALFVWGRLRYDLVALLALLVAIAAGIVPADKAFSGFSDDIVIIVALRAAWSAPRSRAPASSSALRAARPVSHHAAPSRSSCWSAPWPCCPPS